MGLDQLVLFHGGPGSACKEKVPEFLLPFQVSTSANTRRVLLLRGRGPEGQGNVLEMEEAVCQRNTCKPVIWGEFREQQPQRNPNKRAWPCWLLRKK